MIFMALAEVSDNYLYTVSIGQVDDLENKR